MSDWDNIINSTAERSREEGRAEGRAEGLEESRMNIAKKLKECNVDLDLIEKTTGLTKEEINDL